MKARCRRKVRKSLEGLTRRSGPRVKGNVADGGWKDDRRFS